MFCWLLLLFDRNGAGKLFWRDVDTDGVAYHAPYLECFRGWLEREFARIGVGGGSQPALRNSGWISTSTEAGDRSVSG